MNEIKDTAANITTLAGAGSAYMGANEILTIILIVTGIVLNVVRITAMRKSRKKKED